MVCQWSLTADGSVQIQTHFQTVPRISETWNLKFNTKKKKEMRVMLRLRLITQLGIQADLITVERQRGKGKVICNSC